MLPEERLYKHSKVLCMTNSKSFVPSWKLAIKCNKYFFTCKMLLHKPSVSKVCLSWPHLAAVLLIQPFTVNL